jgi:DNA replication licensing factor MCM4
VEKLTKYISYARNKCNPVLGEDAARRLIDCYVELRKQGEDRSSSEKRITATTRQLESMIRMSEAHARMRYVLSVMSVTIAPKKKKGSQTGLIRIERY